MSKYLIRLTPAEPYFFGDENTFRVGEPKASYFIRSLPMPPATSVIGMLRYTLLEQNGLLSTNCSYMKSEAHDYLIGNKSYIPGGHNDFGAIKSISPLFITDREGNSFVPVPLNHKAGKEKYTPLRLRAAKVSVGGKKMLVPEKGEFDAKKSVSGQFMNTKTGEIVSDMIDADSDTRVGIRKKDEEDAYFKKAYCRLKAGCSFAFTAEIDAGLKNTVCYMGRERSPFILEAEKIDDKTLPEITADCGSEKVYYALSDLMIKNKLAYEGFAMVSTGKTRMLSTSYDAQKKLNVSPSNKLYSLIRAGSVFYEKPDADAFYEEGFGLNTIIEIGGNK